MKVNHHVLQLVVTVFLLGCPDENIDPPKPTPEKPIQTSDAGPAQPSTPFDSGDQHQTQPHDALGKNDASAFFPYPVVVLPRLPPAGRI